jgi:hypothetical protein
MLVEVPEAATRPEEAADAAALQPMVTEEVGGEGMGL